MILAISIVSFILFALMIGRIRLRFIFNNQVKSLFKQSKIIDKVYSESQLENLPEAVRRYFKHTLKEGRAYLSFVRIKHRGHFKTGIDKAWISIRGEQYAGMEMPGFIWKGTTRMFTARDLYIENKGGLIVTLLYWFKIVNGKGPQYDQGELLRWLGESVLYPTNLLPSDRLQWEHLTDDSSKLTYLYNGLRLFFTVTFNEKGEIIEMETQRYMDEDHLEKWHIKMSYYKQMNELVVPTHLEVSWRLEKGDFCYAKFEITELEYNRPKLF